MVFFQWHQVFWMTLKPDKSEYGCKKSTKLELTRNVTGWWNHRKISIGLVIKEIPSPFSNRKVEKGTMIKIGTGNTNGRTNMLVVSQKSHGEKVSQTRLFCDFHESIPNLQVRGQKSDLFIHDDKMELFLLRIKWAKECKVCHYNYSHITSCCHRSEPKATEDGIHSFPQKEFGQASHNFARFSVF